MNEEQLRLFIRQAFALQAREGQIIKGQDPALLRAMAQIRRLVETLPPEGTLFREQAWREMLPQVRSYLGPYNDEFARQLRDNLIEEAPEMAEEAVKMVEAVGAPAAPQVPAARAVPTDLGRLGVADNVAAALKSRVNGKRVADLFERNGNLLLSDWMRTNERAINSVVTKGILDGAPTEEIGEGIATIIQRNGQEYISDAGPTAARRIKSDAKAIARTAVQDANRQINEQVWKANESALSDLKWEWVATLDSRTCPICAPRDGQRYDTRQEAPEWPAHINCRCRVVAVDPDETADVRSGIVISPEPPKYKGKTWDQLTAAEKVKASEQGIYATKVKVNGEKFYRKSVDVKAGKGGRTTYADYLKSMNSQGAAGRVTQAEFFGGGEIGRDRAEWFRKRTKAGLDPEKALNRLIGGAGDKRFFKTTLP